MDPNEILARLREALSDYRNSDGSESIWTALESVAELFEALDGWLSRGGFLPDAWQQSGRCPMSDQEALTEALILALTAVGPEKAAAAAALADRIAGGMSPTDVERAKGDALVAARAQQLRAQLDLESDPLA
jgi:hypothetical protein